MTRLLIVVMLLTPAACTQPVDEPAVSFGDAVRSNMVQQIVNPEPATLDPPVAPEGVRRSIMMQRYQIDKVEPPRETDLDTVGSAGGEGQQ
jgi:hypothetical protein